MVASNLCRCTGYQGILRAVRAAADARAGRLMGYVGSRMRRLEDPRLLAGAGHFADDEERPGQLWMRVVRSPVAHAVLGAVDAGDALKLSGVRDGPDRRRHQRATDSGASQPRPR